MADAHFVLAYDVYRIGTQQLVVGQQRPRYGVLYGHSGVVGTAFGDGIHHLLEALAFDRNNRPFRFGKISAHGRVMEASGDALYGYAQWRRGADVCFGVVVVGLYVVVQYHFMLCVSVLCRAALSYMY